MDHHQLHLFDNLRKRRKLDHGEGTNQLSHGDYTVGWVCALPLEAAAAMAMLDNIHPALHTHSRDSNSYTLGSIGNHNVVIACLPAGLYGTTSAATVAGNMFISFGSIRHLLMVGIGGGVPSASADIRLGDVVVSIPTPRFEGVVQYDYGKTIGEGRFERTGTLNKPSTSLLTAVSNLRAEDLRRGSQIPVLMSEMLAQNPQMTKTYTSPGPHKDLLFVPDYEHDQSRPTCELCDRERLVTRLTRGDDQPVVHYGLIASGNQVIKHAQTRDRLATDLNILCFEMEAAGLMDNFPCLVIRGVSDYSDSHKKKEWQGYAAATAAAYAKQLLATIGVSSPRHVSNAEVPRQISMADHRANMMDALRFDQLESRQATIKAAHAKTCTWLLEKKEYMEWLDSNHFQEHRGFLWIKGKAGSGKSTMMKFAFQQAFASRHEETVVISFFFNARGGDLEKTTLGMYRSLLFQLFEKVPELQALLDEVSSLKREENHPWSHTILQHLFRRSIAILSGRRITCFIDALDECEEEQVRAMIDYIQSLGEHAVSSGVQLNVCFSSRHYPHIAVEKGLELVLEDQEGHADDITRYLHSELKIGRSKQAGQIQDEIIEKASGIFLWVVLVVQILRREFERGRLHELRKRLREIPARLSDLFKDILTRDTANMDDLLLSIQWILFAKRPLKLEEFYYAILSVDPDNLTDAWEPGSISPDDMSRFLLDSSKGLAEVTKSKDKTVQFIHESVRDFLLKENGLWELWPQHQDKFEALSHDRLKECCNNFLQTDVRKHIPMEENLPSASSEDARVLRQTLTEQFPFLEYAVRNLFHHADASDRGGIHQEAFIQRLDFATWIRCSNAIERYQIRRYTPSASLLYILAEYNLSNLIRTVRKKEPCINLPGERYHYPLFAALANGNESAVRALQEPDEAFRNIKGAYELAQVVYRNEIQSLIERGKRIKPGRSSSLISFAIEEDEGSLADLIMTACHFVDVNARDNDGQTALHYSVRYGKHTMLSHLLATDQVDTNPDFRNDIGMTPLTYAAREGLTTVVSWLLSTGKVDLNFENYLGWTPLAYAAHMGHADIVKLLLSAAGIDPDSKDNLRWTPLLKATVMGHGDIVSQLLATGRVNVLSQDVEGETALSRAKAAGNDKIVRILEEWLTLTTDS
ncbi:hypothetical protein ASPCADRAFT_150839 [Aspergillus carbonarius ITEM 5010]|uniref:NACHT domain-containing protein n=1 Tax=Aspergillus carbonarius (strain ITEM 5010) TaxID=602072 RepID=A0A1R3RG04_ASPC5|nr:hypothetical protein ASPCADRAFT_150839 [Aspergillus carbonarius ITEM 5010]